MSNALRNAARWMTAVCLSFGLTLTHAAVPAALNYQGFLTNPGTGAPLTTAVGVPLTVTFTLWDALTAGNLVYSETQSVTVTNGVFNVQIGSGAAQTPPNVAFTAVAFDKPYWLEITVGTGGTAQILTPRQPLASSAYALRAAVADNATAVTGTIAGSQVTGSITNATIVGTQVTGTITNATVPGNAPWVVVSGTSQQAASNTGYIVTATTPTTITLPTTPAVGDVVKVTSPGVGGFTLAANAGQTIASPGTPHDSARNWVSVASSADGSKLVAVVGYPGGQIYTSTDSGVTWTPRDSARSWCRVASSADGSKLVTAVQGGQIYTSTDSGATWTPRDSARSWYSVASSADGSKLVAVVNSGQIYASLDSGATWSARESARNWTSAASSADGTKLVAVVNGGQIYTSTDSGVTWNPRDSARNWTSVASSADGTMLVAGDRDGSFVGGYIYTSTDSGVTWVPRGSAGQWYSVASSADGTKLVAVEYYGQVYTSLDSGLTWTPRDSARGWVSVASSADGSKTVAVTEIDKIYTWDNAIHGTQYSTVELAYGGAGLWNVVSQLGVSNDIAGNNANIAGSASITGNVNIAPPSVINFGAGTRQMLNLYGTGIGTANYGIGVQGGVQYFRTDTSPTLAANQGGFAWYKGGVHSDTNLDPGAGGTKLMQLDLAGNVTTLGTINGASDRGIKEAFAEVDARSVLAKVVEMPITSWAFKADPKVRHVGPMAQDFYAAFGVGMDDKHIATVDEGGVALAAIQGLYKTLVAKDREIARIKKKAARVDVLERELAAIKAKLGLQ